MRFQFFFAEFFLSGREIDDSICGGVEKEEEDAQIPSESNPSDGLFCCQYQIRTASFTSEKYPRALFFKKKKKPKQKMKSAARASPRGGSSIAAHVYRPADHADTKK